MYHIGDKIGPKNLEILDRDSKYGKFVCPNCKKIFYSPIVSVSSGNCRGCGCTRKINSGRPKINLVGKQFGELIVIRDSNKRTSRGAVIWECKCSCGNTTYVASNELLRKPNENRRAVSSCGHERSKGEQKIRSILLSENINFVQEKCFKDCINQKTNGQLRFDFYLPDYNCCIEFDGIQHFKDVGWKEEHLEDTQYRDKIKNKYCNEHNIILIRIPYFDYSIIDSNYILTRIEK